MQRDLTPTASEIENHSQNYRFLMEWLYEVRHVDLATLSLITTKVIVEDTFREFHTFLGDLPLLAWFGLFQRYVNRLIETLDRPTWEALWVLRSIEFTRFVKAVEAGEKQTAI